MRANIAASVPRPVRLLAAACAAALAAGLFATAQGTPGSDPLAEPVPTPELIDDARSFIATVDFTSTGSATPSGVRAVNVATPGTEHLKPDVVVGSEVDGQVLRRATIPHPAMSFADGMGYFFQAGRYDVLVPFDARVETIRLSSPEGATIVAADTTAAVREHCIANPNDPQCLEADLSVDALEATGPLFAVLGRPTTIGVTSGVSNGGPDGPVDAIVTRVATADAGLTMTPNTAQTTQVTGFAVGATRTFGDTYTVTCATPGLHTIDLTTTIAPKRAWVVDQDATDDRRTAQLSIDCAIPITINVQPGSPVNPVNLRGSTLPVAALTTAAGEYGNPLAFDATTIDAASLRFASEAVLQSGGGVAELHTDIHPEDSLERDELTSDGDLDAVLHFRPRTDAFEPTDTQGCLLGRAGGVSFFGCDLVTVRS